MLKNNPSWGIRGRIVKQTSKIKSKKAVLLLEKALDDPHQNVRSVAALGLYFVGLPSSIPKLERMAQNEGKSAIKRIKRREKKETKQWLKTLQKEKAARKAR